MNETMVKEMNMSEVVRVPTSLAGLGSPTLLCTSLPPPWYTEFPSPS